MSISTAPSAMTCLVSATLATVEAPRGNPMAPPTATPVPFKQLLTKGTHWESTETRAKLCSAAWAQISSTWAREYSGRNTTESILAANSAAVSFKNSSPLCTIGSPSPWPPPGNPHLKKQYLQPCPGPVAPGHPNRQSGPEPGWPCSGPGLLDTPGSAYCAQPGPWSVSSRPRSCRQSTPGRPEPPPPAPR